MNNEIVKTSEIQLHDATREQNLVVVFPKNRSPSYAGMVMLAKQAKLYGETEIDGSLYHFAGFDVTQNQVQTALGLLQYVVGIKGLQVYTRGKLCPDAGKIHQILACALEAYSCADSRAHCHVVKRAEQIFDVGQQQKNSGFSISMSFSDLFGATAKEDEPDLYIFPCRLMLDYGFKIQRYHPSAEKDQIQAGAIHRGCDFCPHFDQHALKKIR